MAEDTAVEGAPTHEAAVPRASLTGAPPCSRPITGVLSAALLLSFGVPAHAEEEGKSGLTANKLSLPSGPGSLEGIGENAEPNVNMGLLAYGVPIQVPPGYGGLSPSLRLAYSSGSGNSVVGIGWSLGVPRIERMTSRGLPEYDASDLFAAGGGVELVRVGTTATFRARYEGGFVRYTWIGLSGDGRGGYWIADYPDGRTGYFGATQDGELEPAARVEDTGLGTFSYNLVEMVDVLGHRVRYHYEKDQGQSYLARAEWVFGDSATSRYAVELDYEPRDDELSDGKPGFLVTTAQRLSGIRVLVREELLRHYALTYEDLQASGGLSRLAQVTTIGSDDTTEYPVVFGFSYTGSFDPTCSSQSLCNLPYLTTVGSVGVSFKAGLADLTDINGDSLPDVVDTRDGLHVFHVASLTAGGGHTFQQPRQSSVADGGSVVLSSAQVQAADLDGNGFSDLVDAANRTVLWNHGTGDWHEQALVETHLPDFSQDADLRFFDYNHDRAVDVMHNDGDNTWYYLNQGDGTFASQAVDGEATGWGFSGHGAQLADLNGDGMQDLALPLSGQVSYRVNLGYGRFGPVQDMFGLDSSLSPSDMHLVDLNGDSLADVVVVLGSEVRFALNENGRSFSSMQTLSEVDGGSIPEVDATVSVRFADMNGSGSMDIVWINQSGEVTYLELYPRRPNLLSKIETGIGKVIEASYGSAALHMARDGGPEAWAYRLPQPVLTLDRLETYDTLSGVRQVQTLAFHNGFYDGVEKQFRGFRDVDLRTAGDASMEEGESQYVFEVGQYDSYRKGLLLERSQQSDGRLLSVATTSYDDCEVGGLSQATALPVRFICKVEEEQVILEGLSEAEGVTTRSTFEYDAFGNVVRSANLGVTSIGGGGCEPCEYDPSEVHGAACGPACLGDESYGETDYVPLDSAGGRWLLRAPYRKRAYGVAGGLATEELTYYDGEPFVGLGLGELTDGLATRVTQRVSQDSSEVVATGTAYDAHGNPIEVRDANGHRRRFSYDAEDNLLLLAEEAVFDDSDHDPYELRMEVDLHPLFETVSASRDWMRVESGAVVSEPHTTLYDYDVFGRLIALALPGDDLATPTQELSYELSDPVSRIVTRTRSVAGTDPDLEQVQCFDGLGRKVQERTRIEGDEYQVSGFVELNVQGKERTVYQPYVETGSACSESPPGGVLAVHTTYDAAGRVLSVTHPDADIYGTASIEQMLYEPLSVVSFDAEDTDPQSEHYATPTTTISDGLGRSVAIERSLARGDNPVETRAFYDTLGRMSRVVGDAGNVRSYAHDLLGRMLAIDDPDAGRTSFAYDEAGNVTHQTDARGKTTRTRYDEANRPVAVWDADDEDGTLVDYAYDGLDGCSPSVCSHPEGRLVRISFPIEDGVRSASRGVDSFGYDTRGRRSLSLRQFWGVAFASFAQFDNADRLVAAQYPNGTTIESVLDGLGRAVSVPGYVDSVTYTARNQQDEVLLHNGVQTTREYDARMRLAGLESIGPATSLIQGYTYEHDRVGNLQQVQDSRQAGPTADASYSYDSLYRLTEASFDVGRAETETISYAYNRIDNIESKTSSLGASSAAHVGAYRYGERGAGPHAVTSAGGRSYSYDAAGNVVQRGLDSYAWDYQGRLVSASRGPQHRAQFAYGAGRERVLKREGAHTSLYVSPDFEIRDGVSTLYVRLSGERVAKVESLDFDARLLVDLAPEGSPDGQITGGDAYVSAQQGARAEMVHVMQAAAAKRVLLSDGPLVTYLHQNHLGTTAVTTDTQGEILQRTEHYPYGEVRHQSGMLEDYSWTGQERDRRIGLSYHSARYLDTWTGRWTAPDPLFLVSPAKCLESPGQCSLYGYAQNNPVNAVDPTGFYEEDAHGALVYRLAIAAGWNWREAAQISLASASVDHRSDTKPLSPKNILTGATAKYHFASWADARRVMAAGLAGAGSDLNGFGRALHIWMDVGWKEAPGPHAAAGERGHGRLDIGHQLYFTETGELSTIFNHVTDKGYMNPGRSARQLAYVYGILRLGAKTWRPGSVGNQRKAASAIRDFVTADTPQRLDASLDWTSKDAPFSYRQIVEANSRDPSLFNIGATWAPSEIDASRSGDEGGGVPYCPY